MSWEEVAIDVESRIFKGTNSANKSLKRDTEINLQISQNCDP